MTFKPAHKEDDPAKAPGQIRNDVTLADYVQHKMELTPVNQVASYLPKMTFDEWYMKHFTWNESIRAVAKVIWDAAQENK